MLIRQTSTYMVAHGTSAMLGFLSVILFTRLLTPAEYGIYVVALSVAGIISALLFTWVRLSVLRFESEGEATDIRLTALAAYLVSVLTLPAAWWRPSGSRPCRWTRRSPPLCSPQRLASSNSARRSCARGSIPSLTCARR